MRKVGSGLPSGDDSSAEANTVTTAAAVSSVPATSSSAPPVAAKRPRAWQRQSQAQAQSSARASAATATDLPSIPVPQPFASPSPADATTTTTTTSSFSSTSSAATSITAAVSSTSDPAPVVTMQAAASAAANAATAAEGSVVVRLHAYSPQYHLYAGQVQDVYTKWPAPDLIVADGATLTATDISAALNCNSAPLSVSDHVSETNAARTPEDGVGSGSGDDSPLSDFGAWYQPHIAAWSQAAKPATALWLWNTEIGWASLHPQLQAAGWEFVQLVVWNQGRAASAHVSHHRRSGSYRSPAPAVTEVAALYRRQLRLHTPTGQSLPVPEWLRAEWLRSGLPLSEVQGALGGSSALTRFLCGEGKWSWPRGDEVETLARYCSQRGAPSAWFYFSLDGRAPLTASKWQNLKAVWHPLPALTNVWTQPPLSNDERLQGSFQHRAPQVYAPTSDEAKKLRQKPLKLLLQQVYATTNEGAVVWEPFGGLATAAVAAVLLGREAYVAECEPRLVPLMQMRLEQAQRAWEDDGVLTEEQLQEVAKSRAKTSHVQHRLKSRTQLGRTLQGRVLQ